LKINTRIKKLIIEATHIEADMDLTWGYTETEVFDHEKFAQLIAQDILNQLQPWIGKDGNVYQKIAEQYGVE
jgi:hypothetical protein